MAIKPEMQKPGDVVRGEIRTLDSKISLIGQKISTIEKNEEVLGRTLVALNERTKKMEAGGGREGGGGASGEEVEKLKKRMDVLEKSMVTKQEVKELKYTLDTINPLEYATLGQIRELIREELKKKD